MGNLNKFELHACGQQLATSFATLTAYFCTTGFNITLGYCYKLQVTIK
jgi:hypothetical protein